MPVKAEKKQKKKSEALSNVKALTPTAAAPKPAVAKAIAEEKAKLLKTLDILAKN